MKVVPMNGVFYTTFSALGLYNQNPGQYGHWGEGRGVESVRINGVSVFRVQNLGKMYRLFLETKQTVRITTTR